MSLPWTTDYIFAVCCDDCRLFFASLAKARAFAAEQTPVGRIYDLNTGRELL